MMMMIRSGDSSLRRGGVYYCYDNNSNQGQAPPVPGEGALQLSMVGVVMVLGVGVESLVWEKTGLRCSCCCRVGGLCGGDQKRRLTRARYGMVVYCVAMVCEKTFLIL